MSYFNEYTSKLNEKLQKVTANEKQYAQIATLIVESFENGGKLYTFGTGHGHLLALEIFYRAGGLVRVAPILNDELMLHKSASQSTEKEREAGVAEKLLLKSGFTKNDIMFIFSNSGRNAAITEMATCAQNIGGKVIAFTNLAHSKAVSSRGKAAKKLYEIADVIVENFGEIGDAAVQINSGGSICPTSTVIGAAILHLIVAKVVEIAEMKQCDIELFASSNIDGGDELNNKYIEKYKQEIDCL